VGGCGYEKKRVELGKGLFVSFGDKEFNSAFHDIQNGDLQMTFL
jgi:hypothetical protein